LKDQDFLIKGTVNCWFETFELFIRRRGKSLPMPESDFERFMLQWAKQDQEGRMVLSNGQLGFIGNKLAYIEFDAKSKITYKDSASAKEPFYQAW
jgi:hypothetical protein